ncbi:MAG TPA: urease accessory protein UreD [Casimicrobiaceae bacterium]|nr:urease accessory protein UreD [Casimicrobiaceae bacterium]
MTSDSPGIAAETPTDDRVDRHGAATGWDARLALRFECDGARTVLRGRAHVGPLRVQKALYPEDATVCQVVVVHPPAGIVGGDSLAIDVAVGEGAHAQATTPGAAKWYRSAGRFARSSTTIHAESGATVEWLPLETLLFDGARAAIGFAIDLAGDARFIGWDITCLGRTASGERFDNGRLEQRFDLRRDGELLWCDRIVLEGGARALQSGAILGGAPVFGTMIATPGDANDALLAACRGVRCESGDAAITRLPHVFVARFVGDSVAAARTYFATLWGLLRPALARREAVHPRIWNT